MNAGESHDADSGSGISTVSVVGDDLVIGRVRLTPVGIVWPEDGATPEEFAAVGRFLGIAAGLRSRRRGGAR